MKEEEEKKGRERGRERGYEGGMMKAKELQRKRSSDRGIKMK